MVNPLHRVSTRKSRSQSVSDKAASPAVLNSPNPDTFTLAEDQLLRWRMEQLLTPRYVSTVDKPKLSATARTTRFHAVEMDLFYSQRRPAVESEKMRLDLVPSGVFRTVKIPENYSLAHLEALVCFLMGWPMETAFRLWIRQERMNGRSGPIEVWFCLPTKREAKEWAVVHKNIYSAAARSSIKLSEVWNPYGLMSNRLRPYTERPYFAPGSLSVRIRCEGASLHSPLFLINEPFAISGSGAPPASYLPRLRDGRELRENLETKNFEGWAFSYAFWEFVEGRTISEVDVEGVHVWDVDSDEFLKRLDILERRAGGNWMADLEEHAIELENDFLVISKALRSF